MSLVLGGTFSGPFSYIANEQGRDLGVVDLEDIGKAISLVDKATNLGDIIQLLDNLAKSGYNIEDSQSKVYSSKFMATTVRQFKEEPQSFRYRDIILTNGLGLRDKVREIIKEKGFIV